MRKLRDILLLGGIVALVASVILNTGHVVQEDIKAGILFGAIESALSVAFLAALPADVQNRDLYGFIRLRYEYVTGTYDRTTGLVNLEGTKVSDPDFLIPDLYKLRIFPNGTFEGMTRSQKAWEATAEGKVVVEKRP